MRKAIPRLLPLLMLAASCRDPASVSSTSKPVTLTSTVVSARPRPLAEPAPAPSKPAPVLHTIDEGQTLWDIARVYGVTLKQLMESNGFSASDVRRLRKGSQLKVERNEDLAAGTTPKALPQIQDGAYHTLSQGESLWTLARMYDVPIEAIMMRNGSTAICAPASR
jgi:LysM repeat protein